MARPKRTQENIRKLTLVGQKSLSVTIPARIVKQLQLLPGDSVLVRREGRKIIIEEWEA